jgi:hypothetical protein
MARYVVLALVAIWTVASLPIGLAIWPPAAGMPPTRLLPVIALVSLFEGAAFGLGVVFLVFGSRVLRAAGRWTPLTSAAYAGIAWLLVSWWPHDGLHRSGFGRTIAGVAAIDIAFHTTLILATAAVAVFFIRAIRSPVDGSSPKPAAEPFVPTA